MPSDINADERPNHAATIANSAQGWRFQCFTYK